MGIFYYVHAVALAEDLPEARHPHDPDSLKDFYTDIDRGYTQVRFFQSSPITKLLNFS